MEGLQIIHTPKGDDMVVLPLKQYRKLFAAQATHYEEDDELSERELRVIARRLAEVKDGKVKMIPFEEIKKKMGGLTHPVYAIRKHRGLTAAALAKKAKVGRVTITHIENRTRKGTIDNYKAIAKALGVSVDSIIEWSDR